MKVNKAKINWSMFLVAFIMLEVNVLPTNAQDNVEPIIKENYAQKRDPEVSYSLENLGDSLTKYTLTKTRFSKTTFEIKIDYNKIQSKIIAVVDNGVKILPSEFPKYQHYIQEAEDEKKRMQSELEKNHLQAKNDQAKVESAHIKIKDVLQKFTEELIANGYQIENKSFRKEYKNIWCLNFSDKIYLDNKLLPEKLTEKLLKIENDNSIKIGNAPNGLNVELERLNAEMKHLNDEIKVNEVMLY
jgi:hypothetical protein